MERAVPVAPSALPSFSDAIHPAPAADDALDVLGDPVAQSLELRNRFRRGPNGALKIAVHRRLSSLFCTDSIRRFSTAHGASRTGDRGVAGDVFARRRRAHDTARRRTAGAELAAE